MPLSPPSPAANTAAPRAAARRRYSVLTATVAILATISLAAGCGGGGGDNGGGGSTPTPTPSGGVTTPTPTPTPTPTGTASVTVPLPAGSASVRYAVTGPGIERTGVVDGTSNTINFSETLAPGTYNVTATAYPAAGGNGVAQWTGSATVTITSGGTATATVSVASTVRTVTLTPGDLKVREANTAPLSAICTDAAGAVVAVPANRINWASNSPEIATVDANGVVTGVRRGAVEITATHADSNTLGVTVVTVEPGIGNGVVEVN